MKRYPAMHSSVRSFLFHIIIYSFNVNFVDYTATSVGVLGPDLDTIEGHLGAEEEEMDHHTHGMWLMLLCFFS